MNEFENLDDEERLKAENDFLKMKLALERGMQLNMGGGADLPPEVENEFLKHIQEFERQFDQEKTIRLVDKIGNPGHFRKVAEIPDESLIDAYEELLGHLGKHGICFEVLSPNIDIRELYRFITEELFEHEMEDISIPGMFTHFIYDEFYPDPVYDNSRIAHDLVADIFSERDLFYEIHYSKDGFTFNGASHNFESFKAIIQRFKSVYDGIVLESCNVDECVVNNSDCVVKGNYHATATIDGSENIYSGKFKINFLKTDIGYWEVRELAIEGFNP